MPQKAIIIGAGIGGIATAIRLARKGYETEVFEANSYPGGKLTVLEQSGYRFDAGPSLFTLPSLVDELFELCGKTPANYFSYKQLDEICRYFWEDGTRLRVPADAEQFATEAEKALGEPRGNILKYLNQSRFRYDILSPLFIERSLHQWSTWFSAPAMRGYFHLPKLGIFNTLHQSHKNHFATDKAVQLFDRYATYNGSDPYQTPATMGIIPHLEYNTGAYFPKGGMHEITMSLFRLAEEQGVRFHFGQAVTEILTKENQIQGIKTNSGEVFARTVVSNMDVTPTYRRLLPGHRHPDRILDQPKSGSGLIFYWGVRKTFDALGLHNIFFSDDYRKEFDYQFRRGEIYDDPTIYLNISSKIQKEDAPDGCENWFILLNAPADTGQDWDRIISRSRSNVLKKLSRIMDADLSPFIECEAILDPVSIAHKTSSSQGALYGNSSNNRFAAFLRHPNFSSAIRGLYFVGGSVHPGGGIPLALSSAKITVNLMA